MAIEVREAPDLPLAEYARVPISFRVASRLVHSRDAPAGFPFAEEPVAEPRVKDYDAEGNRPEDWAARWDLSRWGILAARDADALVGCAALAWSTPEVDMLEGRDDLAVLWDIRVAPEWRGRGVGRALFDAAVRWARARGVRELVIETQDVNVAACRFYAARGCAPSRIVPGAYPELPDETQILWRLEL